MARLFFQARFSLWLSRKETPRTGCPQGTRIAFQFLFRKPKSQKGGFGQSLEKNAQPPVVLDGCPACCLEVVPLVETLVKPPIGLSKDLLPHHGPGHAQEPEVWESDETAYVSFVWPPLGLVGGTPRKITMLGSTDYFDTPNVD